MLPSTILVADDEEANRRLLENLLRREGHEVLLAKDGNEAAELLASQHADLVLLDVRMPGRTGFDVCHMIEMDAKPA